MEYEHFLYRLFAFKEKTLQAWNALRGSLLALGQVKPGPIEKQLKKYGYDALHAELVAFWAQERPEALMEKRNIVAHRHPWVDGFLYQGPPVSTEGGKGRRLDMGTLVGKIDWTEAKRELEDGVMLAYKAREIVTRHEVESLAPWIIPETEL